MGRLGSFFGSLGTPRPPRLTKDGRVLRFDVHQRLQHVLMFSSLMTLVLTGWPLKAAGVGVSRHLATALGGVENLGLIHRVAAVVMLIASAYHFLYLMVLAARKQLQFDIVPGPQDLRDLAANLRYYLGLQQEPPGYGRFTYFEKFDYFAVFWGIVVIGGSGLVLWFPVKATAILPSWIVNIAFIAHSDEALLALMYLFIFHFYMVHLRPAIFPMSWVWIDGKMSLSEYRHEHGRDFERIPREDLEAAARKATERGDEEAESVLEPPEAEAPPAESAAADTAPTPSDPGPEDAAGPAGTEDDDAKRR
jgi:cytochrome b subunit of formate dehydrogenase